jgi:hypothetical protein
MNEEENVSNNEASLTQKAVHFIFLISCTLLIARMLALSSLNFSLIWIGYAVVMFATMYFPFTSQAFNFYLLPLEEKVRIYIKRTIIIDMVIGIIGALPFLFCFISGTSECYIALLSYAIWFALGTIIGVQVIICGVIFIIDKLEKSSLTLKYVGFSSIIGLLIFLNIFAYAIPGSQASTDKNSYFEKTGQCPKIEIENIPQSELSRIGCGDFYEFDEEGNPKELYKNVAPINAFRKCYYVEEQEVGKGGTMHIIDCRESNKYPNKKIEIDNLAGISQSVYSQSGHVPDIDSYGFDQDESYFKVCSIIIADYIDWKKDECKKAA